MKTNRRGFLGLFGAAAIAGPKVAEINLSTILQAPMGGATFHEGMVSGLEGVAGGLSGNDAPWAKTQLKALIGKTAAQKARELSRAQVYQYDQNVATLRSVSMTQKIRISKYRLYEKQERRERLNLEGIINGWW